MRPFCGPPPPPPPPPPPGPPMPPRPRDRPFLRLPIESHLNRELPRSKLRAAQTASAQRWSISQYTWRFSVDAECPVKRSQFSSRDENRKLTFARAVRRTWLAQEGENLRLSAWLSCHAAAGLRGAAVHRKQTCANVEPNVAGSALAKRQSTSDLTNRDLVRVPCLHTRCRQPSFP